MESGNKKSKTVKIGIGLVRVSSKAQADVQHGSLEQQKHMLQRWAERQSEKTGCEYRIIRVVEEDISGRGESIHKRTGFHEVRREIKNGRIDFFVVEKLDRLSRDKIENQIFIESAAEAGVEVYEVESGLINLRDRGNRLGFNIKNLLAEEYSLELEEKISKKQREARVNNGKDVATMPILALDAHPTKLGMYVINESERNVVEDIFEQFCSLGGSLTELAKYCDKRGYRTKIRYTKEKTDKDGNRIAPRKLGGIKFDIKSLRFHLTNPKYRGFGFFKDTWNQFPRLQDANGLVRWDYHHGPVIHEELFDLVQKMLDQNKIYASHTPHTGNVYLLSGIFRHADGSRFQGASAKSGQNHYYLNKKHKLRIHKEKIEKVVLDRVKEYMETGHVLKNVIQLTLKHRGVGVPALEERLKEIRERIEALKEITAGFSQRMRTAVVESPESLDQVVIAILGEKTKSEVELKTLTEEYEELASRRARLTAEERERSIKEYLTLAMKRFAQRPEHQQKKILQTIVPIVVIHPDNRLELRVNATLSGCHILEEEVRLREEWRGGRDSARRFY
jgi:DNA invertase Pin-like site-specific DNA recombinase